MGRRHTLADLGAAETGSKQPSEVIHPSHSMTWGERVFSSKIEGRCSSCNGQWTDAQQAYHTKLRWPCAGRKQTTTPHVVYERDAEAERLVRLLSSEVDALKRQQTAARAASAARTAKAVVKAQEETEAKVRAQFWGKGSPMRLQWEAEQISTQSKRACHSTSAHHDLAFEIEEWAEELGLGSCRCELESGVVVCVASTVELADAIFREKLEYARQICGFVLVCR